MGGLTYRLSPLDLPTPARRASQAPPPPPSAGGQPRAPPTKRPFLLPTPVFDATAWSALGRNHAPALLFDMILGHQIEKSPAWSPDAWSAAEYPERVGDLGCMPAYLWVQLFTEAGYTNDGEFGRPSH